MAIHMYWAQLLPFSKKMVIRQLTKVCRSFLWKGQAESASPGLIAWDSLCLSKMEGGLGFRDIGTTRKQLFNESDRFKLIWAIDEKKDNLWVRWVHHIYLKGDNIWEHTSPENGSFNWRKLMAIRDEFKEKGIVAELLA